jgi:hypothetical protein
MRTVEDLLLDPLIRKENIDVLILEWKTSANPGGDYCYVVDGVTVEKVDNSTKVDYKVRCGTQMMPLFPLLQFQPQSIYTVFRIPELPSNRRA